MPSMPDAIVLCGGQGLRLRSVTGNAPKAMASIADRPFLELLFKQLERYGFHRAILAVGYQQGVIRSYFGDQVSGLQLTYSTELSPLGTGGALRNAAGCIGTDAVLVMNGDSYTEAGLDAFVVSHNNSGADVSVVVVPADGRTDCGAVVVDRNGKVVRFEEKQGTTGSQYVNAGIYIVSRRAVYDIPPEVQVSLEKDLFPKWLGEDRYIRVFACTGRCVDIGTPERYQSAQDLLANAEVEASAPGREN